MAKRFVTADALRSAAAQPARGADRAVSELRASAPRLSLALAGLLTAALLPIATPEARAVHYRVRARTAGDAYQLVTGAGDVLNRRRLHQTLGLEAHDLLSDGSHTLSVATLLRFDADFGLTDDAQVAAPSLEREQLSLQYAFVEGRDLAGLLDLRLGRQAHFDALDPLMLDGAVATLRSPWGVGLELIMGLEVQDAASDLNASALELDGARILGDLDDAAAHDVPTTWVLGASLVTTASRSTRARLGYRRLFSSGAVDAEKLGGSLYQRLGDTLHLTTTGSYDLVHARFDRLQAGLRWALGDALDLEAELVRLLPLFDTDSIFNLFAAQPLNDANLRLRLHPSDRSTLYLGGLLRFAVPGDGDDADRSDPEPLQAWGAMAGYAHRFGPRGRLRADLAWEGGASGARWLADLGTTLTLAAHEWELDARLTFLGVTDPLARTRDTVSGGYQLGARYLVRDGAVAELMVEQHWSQHAPSHLRVFALLDLDVWP